MHTLRLPTLKETLGLYDCSLFPSINRKILAIKPTGSNKHGILQFKRNVDMEEYPLQLHYRIVDAGKSYAFMSYFFGLGIPDDEWHAPGRSGQSVEYFPHFKEVHFGIKEWFGYYEDFFFFKLFSGLDMIGQMLNAYYDLGIDEFRISFSSSLNGLKSVDQELYSSLHEISQGEQFRSAATMRNSSAHRRQPSSVGMTVTNPERGLYQFGIHRYVTSKEVMEISDGMTRSLDSVVDVVALHLT